MNNDPNTRTRTNPIPIQGRARSSSIASSIPALSNSPTSPIQPTLQTPRISPPSNPHARSASDSSTGGSPTSPLAYFLGAATSPIRTTTGNGFPFTKAASLSAANPIEEEDELPSNVGLFGTGAHTRRGSWAQTAFATGGGIQPTVNGPPTANDRGAGVLRRLSLSGAFQRPTVVSPTAPAPPPPSAVSPTAPKAPTLAEPRPGRKMRSGSLNVPSDPTKKRGISPMGERLLKGHFDGFI